MMEKNYHEGHRDRMRSKFEEFGGDVFEPHEMLEMLLYYCIPRRDTNELAHALLDHFNGSVSLIFDASVAELMEVKGISRNAAVLIKMIPTLSRMYEQDIMAPKDVIKTTAQAREYFKKKFYGREYEMFYAAYLDNNMRVLKCDTIAQGTVNTTNIDVGKIIKGAVATRASYVVISHNHPRGLPLPSKEDVRGTKIIFNSLHYLGVKLIDHVIVGRENEPESMADSLQYKAIFNGDFQF